VSRPRPTVFSVAGLGLGAASFAPLQAALADRADVVPVELPGCGGRPASDGTSLDGLVHAVEAAVRARGAARWLLLGHSLGAKVVSLVAARAMSGEAPVFGLAGVVLLAGSPPSPEPMSDEQRATMLAWAGTGRLDHAAARSFVDSNTGAALPRDLDALATGLVRSSDPALWTEWLTRGSREDRSDEVDELDLPAAVLAGGADGPLGPHGQRELVAPHFPRAQVEVLAGAGHLLHLERPDEVAAAVARLWDEHAGHGPTVPLDVAALLAGDRVSARTRGALAQRAVADDPAYTPRVLTGSQLRTLRAVAARVVPQEGSPIDLAVRVDAGLHSGETDGWRPAELPSDREAYAHALDHLAGFADLDPDAQDDVLARLADGTADPAPTLSASQLAAWFGDMCDDLVRRWVMHPATLARIGYDGFAIGGDRPRLTGFVQIGLGSSEPWEPASVVTA
jgi:pimeloyl-ACP methyl ester carboxylesterase